jgi:hypothetical protein
MRRGRDKDLLKVNYGKEPALPQEPEALVDVVPSIDSPSSFSSRGIRSANFDLIF